MSLTPCNKWLARVSDAAQQALLPAQATLAAPAAHAHEAERESQQAQAAQRRHGLMNGQASSEVAVRKRVNSVMVQFKKEMTINMMRAGTHNVKEIQGSKLLTDADFK